MQKLLRITPLLFLLSFFFLFVSCADDDDDNPVKPDDKDAADECVAEANDELESIMLGLINAIENDAVEEPGDIDMTYAYNLYLDALEKDADHPTANFGAGILGIAMLTQDDEIQAMFDRLSVMEDYIPFQIDTEAETASPGTTPLPGKNWAEIPALSPKIPVNPLVVFSEDVVTINELRSLIRDTFLPTLNTAIDRLELTVQDADFTFTITPRMQGDANEDAIEIDNTDIHALMAGLYCMRAIGYHAIAYNFDLGEYTTEELMTALDQQSDFAALSPGGAEYMSLAGNSWLSALVNLETAIHLLEGEADPQSNDFIRIDPYDGMAQADLDTLLEYIPKVRETITSQSDWTIDTDTGEEVTISLNAFFYTPIPDLKALLPAYSVTHDTTFREGKTGSMYSNHSSSREIPDTLGGYYDRYGCWAYGNMYRFSEYGDEYMSEYINDIWQDLIDEYVDPGYPYVSIDLSIDASYYYNWVEIYSRVYWHTNSALVARPVIIWQANSVDDWVFSDPTLNGALPGMTNTRLKDILQIDESVWTKQSILKYF